MKEIDWKKVKSGDRFTAEICNKKCEGKIHKGRDYKYLCQDVMEGVESSNKQGYKYSWSIGDGSPEDLNGHHINVTNLKIISQTKKPMAKKQTFEERYKNTILVKKPMAKKTTTRKTVIRTFKTSNRSKWEIVKAVTGDKTEYFCRLTSRNGNILSTGRGMNNVQNAIKNIKAVMNSCKVVEPTVGKIKK